MKLDRSEFVVEFVETFASGELSPARWVPHYLPHWTTPERSAARFDLTGATLRLNGVAWRVTSQQPQQSPAGDGELLLWLEATTNPCSVI